MQSVIPIIVSVVVGSLLALGTQWFTLWRSERLERAKWQHEDSRERGEAVRHYREQRARAVIEALDRARERWDWESISELAHMIGYYGEKVETQR